MKVRLADARLEQMERDARFSGGHAAAIVKAFRRRMQVIRAASDEREFYALKSLHLEKLQGDRSHQRSMRLNKQWRLILEFEGESPDEITVVVAIEDYR